MASDALASPVRLGAFDLKHRVVLAPLTRLRADKDHVHHALAKEYYTQRASVPGTLLISEATFISPGAGGMENVPGIWSDAQIRTWKSITDSVHANGCQMILQLWALGRAASQDVLARDGFQVHSSGNIPMSKDSPTPKALSENEIREYISDYAQAARNAIRAGFDGVEIHGANGYLIDQFTEDVSNNRTDKWGGSIENRARFGLEVAKAVCDAVGADRVGYRMSPWSTFQSMGMADPKPQFSYLAQKLCDMGLAYLHIVRARVAGDNNAEENPDQNVDWLLDIALKKNGAILAGRIEPEKAREIIEQYQGKSLALAFGRYFIANPDLPFRLNRGIKFTKYDRNTFYKSESPEGYVDYPFSNEYLSSGNRKVKASKDSKL